MTDWRDRTKLLIGESAVLKLQNAKVAVFGVGGVGGYVCEALARGGVGHFVLTDNDTVSLTNLNRQIIATHDTIGRYKTEVMKERILSINPEAKVTVNNCFFLPENADDFCFEDFDYVADCVDTVAAKLEIILRSKEKNVPVISAMGAGNKLDATGFMVADIYDTEICPLARVMRRELKKRGVEDLKVVYSKEKPISVGTVDESADTACDESHVRRSTPGSISFVPAVAGLTMAGEIIKDIIK